MLSSKIQTNPTLTAPLHMYAKSGINAHHPT